MRNAIPIGVLLLLPSLGAGSAPPLELPSPLKRVDGMKCIVLRAGSEDHRGDSKDQFATFPGRVVEHDADRAFVQGAALILAKKGYARSKAVLSFTLDNRASPGRYELWTRFSLGGIATESFTFLAGTDENHLTARTAFGQPNNKSWEMAWRRSAALLTLYPGERIVRVSIDGPATQQKNIEAFLLVPIGKLPAGMTASGGEQRATVDAIRPTTDVKRRLYILEGDSASGGDTIFEGLASHEAGALLADVAIEHFFGAEAVDLAGKARLASLPALILMDDRYAVEGELSWPHDPSEVISFLKSGEIASNGLSASPPAPSPKTADPLRGGIPAQWLVAGTWAGPGGISLWGIDAETQVRPAPNDPCAITQFDTVEQKTWETRQTGADGAVVIDPAGPDTAWPRGSDYAHVYFHVDTPTHGRLHLAHGGIACNVWIDGQPAALSADNSPPAAAKAVGSAREVEGGVTDQGNALRVVAAHRQGPQRAEFVLEPGWHRMLIKMIIQSAKGEPIRFAAVLTDQQDRPLAGSTSLADPDGASAELHATAMRLTPLVSANVPFCLAHPGEPLSLKIFLRWISSRGEPGTVAPIMPFDGALSVRVIDYEGRELSSHHINGTWPGEATVDLGPAPGCGHYGLQLALSSPGGKLIAVYPPDGFNVIGGTQAQSERKASKKVATTYYFMAADKAYETLYFPYMKRMGIYRNVGGTNGRSPEFYDEAHRQGLALAADFWNYRDEAYLRQYVQETAADVDSYKSFNEIDIRPDQKGTPESWVEREQLQYAIVRELNPHATVLGGSLVRVGNDPWFEQCLRLGLDKWQDVWDVHAYPKEQPLLEGTLSNSANESDLGLIAAYRRLGRKNDKPFWMGETGARASHGLDARRWQADAVAKMVAWANSREDFKQIGFLIPWSYSRARNSINDIEVAHMPAEAALYTANALIDGMKYVRQPLGKDIQAAWFGDTLMAWAPHDAQAISIPLPKPGPWLLVDVLGRSHPLTVEQNGTARLMLSQSPVYAVPVATYRQLTG